MSGAPEEPRIACTWCGLFSTPGFCDSCGSPLPTVGFSVEASDQGSSPPPATPVSSPPVGAFLPAENEPSPEPLPEPVPVEAAGVPEGIQEPAEILALVEDPAPLVEERADPEPPAPTESLESPGVETLALEAEAASDSTQPLNLVDQKPDPRSDEGPEAETSQGPRCPSCGRAGRGGLCETCREAIRELSALSQ